MNLKTLLTVLTCIFSISLAFAQQDSQYTHYMYNTIVVNPGYAGSRGAMSLFAMHRNQWVGFDGAPKTNAFSIHTPFASSNIGAGLSFVNDQIGPTAENTITAAVSYTLIVSKKFSLNFGLNTSATFFNFYANKLNPKDVADTTLENFKNSISPNLGIGFYLHSDKTYFGLSAPQLFENYKYDDNELSLNRERINLYFITGTVIPINSDIDFKPAFLAKYLDSTPLQMDLSANFLFNQKLTLGAAYRYDAAVSALAGFQISEMLFVGYAYDFETTQLQKYNQGSHEIFLRFELFKSYSGLSSPRFF
uniref:PorP/SprF family type IX secretion system membrane protein n=1 Tax=Flavobacterium ardleyense TaxID=2038737 RepID=UPI00298BE9B1|nr:type IX secretion system membrane protein PorP/SprF [Flavobacterium ardleyense]